MSGINGIVNGGSAIAIGVYLCAVVYKGNVQELGNLVKNESGYIDFVGALFILGAIQKFGPAGKISTFLTAATLIGLAMKVSSNANFGSAISDFASGKASILETIEKLSGVK